MHGSGEVVPDATVNAVDARPVDNAAAQHDADRSETEVTLTPRIADRIGDASYDSFPASDPPSWTGTHAGAPRLKG